MAFFDTVCVGGECRCEAEPAECGRTEPFCYRAQLPSDPARLFAQVLGDLTSREQSQRVHILERAIVNLSGESRPLGLPGVKRALTCGSLAFPTAPLASGEGNADGPTPGHEEE
ncbi:hypothetical protein B1759_03665 [Rubrivirga sp. SAORIC476]|nr:hypothetical protein B1759_03665 [Rubrivirga sp. SAORIC476]